MSDVLIAWVADGDGDSGLHVGYEIRRGRSLRAIGRESELLCWVQRTVKVVCMTGEGGRLWQSPKDLLGDGLLPTEILARSGTDRFALPTLHCFVA